MLKCIKTYLLSLIRYDEYILLFYLFIAWLVILFSHHIGRQGRIWKEHYEYLHLDPNCHMLLSFILLVSFFLLSGHRLGSYLLSYM